MIDGLFWRSEVVNIWVTKCWENASYLLKKCRRTTLASLLSVERFCLGRKNKNPNFNNFLSDHHNNPEKLFLNQRLRHFSFCYYLNLILFIYIFFSDCYKNGSNNINHFSRWWFANSTSTSSRYACRETPYQWSRRNSWKVLTI